MHQLPQANVSVKETFLNNSFKVPKRSEALLQRRVIVSSEVI